MTAKKRNDVVLDFTGDETSKDSMETSTNHESKMTPKERSNAVSDSESDETPKDSTETSTNRESKMTPKKRSNAVSDSGSDETPKDSPETSPNRESKVTPKRRSNAISDSESDETPKDSPEISPNSESKMTPKKRGNAVSDSRSDETLKDPAETTIIPSQTVNLDHIFRNFPKKLRGPTNPEMLRLWKEVQDMNNVVVLTKDNFTELVKSNTYAMVAFCRPDCAYCALMVPKYAAAATELKSTAPMVILAMVDGTTERELVREYGIQVFPTILLFVDGEMQESYDGEKNKDAIVGWLKEKIVASSTP